MQFEPKSVFNEVLTHIDALGIERNYFDFSQIEGTQVPDWLQGRIIYEIYVRAFSPEGTFSAVQKKLPELKALGVDILWFMPIFPIGQKSRKGSRGCPYAIRDYFTVNPEYGTEADFKDLVRQAHQFGMRVLIDMVPNHVAPDYRYLEQLPDLITRDEQGRPTRKIKEWTDVVDLDYTNPRTREHMAKVMRFWIEEYDVDGYRCDVAGMVPLSFWEWVVPQLKELKEDFFLLAEWESPELHLKAFNATYDWSTFYLLTKVFKKECSLNLLARWILTKKYLYPRQALPLRFLENHDLPRAAAVFEGQKLKAALIFIFSLHGIPLIYNGQEIGVKTYLSLFEKQEVDWQNEDRELKNFVKTLIELRKKLPQLSSDSYEFDEKALVQNVWFLKKKELQILINFNDQEIDLNLKPKLPLQEIILSTDNLKVDRGKMVLKPYQAVIAKVK